MVVYMQLYRIELIKNEIPTWAKIGTVVVGDEAGQGITMLLFQSIGENDFLSNLPHLVLISIDKVIVKTIELNS